MLISVGSVSFPDVLEMSCPEPNEMLKKEEHRNMLHLFAGHGTGPVLSYDYVSPNSKHIEMRFSSIY